LKISVISSIKHHQSIHFLSPFLTHTLDDTPTSTSDATHLSSFFQLYSHSDTSESPIAALLSHCGSGQESLPLTYEWQKNETTIILQITRKQQTAVDFSAGGISVL